MSRIFVAAAALAAIAWIPAAAAAPAPAGLPALRYSDAETFYALFDGAAGRPSAALLQRFYLDAGSEALAAFVPQRIVSAEALAEAVAADPAAYRDARVCLDLMPQLDGMIAESAGRLRGIYPEAAIPDVTILIGRNTSGGTTGPAGVMIGLEVACRAQWPSDRPVEQRLRSFIAHEMAHASQPFREPQTLLEAAIKEGTAELIAELISGEVLYDHLKIWTRGREAEIERAFLAELDRRDPGQWMFNGVGTPEAPGDLAYWAGYRIARSYYDRAPDKRAALRRLLGDPDVHAIVRDSGWAEQGNRSG